MGHVSNVEMGECKRNSRRRQCAVPVSVLSENLMAVGSDQLRPAAPHIS